MKRSRWFALIPLIAGISLLLPGYHLDDKVIGTLGITIAGFVLIFLSGRKKYMRLLKMPNSS